MDEPQNTDQAAEKRIAINLFIGKEQYPLTVEASQEGFYRSAAKLINARLSRYQSRYPGQPEERYLQIVLLDIAVQLMQREDELSTKPYRDCVGRLTKEVENLLNVEQH